MLKRSYTLCNKESLLRTVGFCRNLSSVKNVCASVHVILGSVRTIVLAIPTVIMDVHVLMKGTDLTLGTCLWPMLHRLCYIGYLGSIQASVRDGSARLKWILWSLRGAFWRRTRSMSENQYAGKIEIFQIKTAQHKLRCITPYRKQETSPSYSLF